MRKINSIKKHKKSYWPQSFEQKCLNEALFYLIIITILDKNIYFQYPWKWKYCIIIAMFMIHLIISHHIIDVYI